MTSLFGRSLFIKYYKKDRDTEPRGASGDQFIGFDGAEQGPGGAEMDIGQNSPGDGVPKGDELDVGLEEGFEMPDQFIHNTYDSNHATAASLFMGASRPTQAVGRTAMNIDLLRINK